MAKGLPSMFVESTARLDVEVLSIIIFVKLTATLAFDVELFSVIAASITFSISVVKTTRRSTPGTSKLLTVTLVCTVKRGTSDGSELGESLGDSLGMAEGIALGRSDTLGELVGNSLEEGLGDSLGVSDGVPLGKVLGDRLGAVDGK